MSQGLNDDLRSFMGAEKYMESDFCEKIFAGVDQWRADLKIRIYNINYQWKGKTNETAEIYE